MVKEMGLRDGLWLDVVGREICVEMTYPVMRQLRSDVISERIFEDSENC